MRHLNFFIVISVIHNFTVLGVANDYGAEAANSRFSGSSSTGGGEYNYLALRDHTGPSGVPLGGIGTGCFDLAPDGRFTRVALSNTHEDGPIKDIKGSFFALWERQVDDEQVNARRLVRDTTNYCGIGGYDHTTYRGLFPMARIAFDNDRWPQPSARVSLLGYSGLVPHNIKDSALPVVWFEVTVVNHFYKAGDVSVAFSWEDVIGRNIRDIRDANALAIMDNNDCWNLHKAGWGEFKRVPTFVEPISVGSFKGLRQYVKQPLVPLKATFQNYISEIAILAEAGPDVSINLLPAYEIDNPDQAWKSFADNGEFNGKSVESQSAQMWPKKCASAISAKIRLKAGEKRTIRFMVAWYQPELFKDRSGIDPKRYWGSTDYGRYFHNYFGSIQTLIEYAATNRGRILKETQEWQDPILSSTYPDWLKFKLINSAYTLYTNTILNKQGLFSVMEGGMGGLAGTMDQRISAHPVYQKFFTQLDRTEMNGFAASQKPDGAILHFDAHYYLGITTPDGHTPTPNWDMLDNTAGWIIQLAKDYAQTGDMEYLKSNAEHVRKGFESLKSCIKGQIQIPHGNVTYDDYKNPEVCAYMGGVYLATLRAGEYIGTALNDEKLVRECSEQFARTQKDYIKYLWTGSYFACGSDRDGRAIDDRIFTGQLAGQFLSRYCGWGDVVPFDMAQAAALTQLKSSVSYAPDYYAPKVFDPEIMRGVDAPGSQCWPFYLESYTAMMAMQTGYVADGLDIMKHIQLVHLRKGWTWTQNLWNPAELTYMTAPVTWFITDVLAGAALDVPGNTLFLAPVIGPNVQEVRLPLYFPTFWAMLECDVRQQKAKLVILKTFGEKTLTINHIVVEPAGIPTSKRTEFNIKPFAVQAGSILDISSHWAALTASAQCQAVLSNSGEVPSEYIANTADIIMHLEK